MPDVPPADVPNADVPPADVPPAGQPVPVPPNPPLTRAARRAALESHGYGPRGSVEPPPTGPPTAPPTDLPVAVATAALGLLLALSAGSGPIPTALALAFTGVVLAWGWPVLLGCPSARSTSLLVGTGAVAVSGTVALTDEEPFLRWVPVAVAVSVIAAFLHQLGRRDGRPGLAHGVATSVSGLALAAAGAPLAALPSYPGTAPYVVAAMTALSVAALVELLGRWNALNRWPAANQWLAVPVVVLGAASAVAAAGLVHGIPLAAAASIGALVAGVSHALRRAFLALPGARGLQARMAAAAGSVLVVGVVVYLLTRVYAA